MCIGMGTRGAGGAVALPTKLLGEQPVHPAPQFFLCNIQLKLTLLLTQRFSKVPQLLGFAPDPVVAYTAYTFFEKYILHKVSL